MAGLDHHISFNRNLTPREKDILRLVVRSFIDMKGPVGSRYLARNYDLQLSAASIRNTMSDLEEYGYLGHPYTSAGRVPTDLGYRTFVDHLMESIRLSAFVRNLIRKRISKTASDAESLQRESSRLLGQLTQLLGIVVSPKLAGGVLERLEVVPLSSTRVMFVISVMGGVIRTIILPLETDLKRPELNRVVSILNERLVGLTLLEIRNTCAERIKDISGESTGLARLAVEASPRLFDEAVSDRTMLFAGTPYLVAQPDFKDAGEINSIIALLEDRETIVRLFEEHGDEQLRVAKASISIGQENSQSLPEIEKLEQFSIITAQYQIGGMLGTIGVIGPKRMDYAKVQASVEAIAAVMSEDN